MKNPYQVIKSRYITEKSTVLERLQDGESNKSQARCHLPKYVFLVDRCATKPEIAHYLMEIYKEKGIKVTSVNTILVKPKKKRQRRGRPGATAAFKKAIVTLEEGDQLDDV
ncbi:MAG: 50S ribosomal protein L23 [Chlamydiia bacterium]|nr:50S ribosomal protein L23 [Chlamydiia bacterium]